MPPKRETYEFYKELMGEVKERFLVIDRAVIGRFDMPPPLVREVCYLQLRMLCETVALACLVAHGDVAPKIRNSWKAEEVMQGLEKLNPRFYPQAASRL